MVPLIYVEKVREYLVTWKNITKIGEYQFITKSYEGQGRLVTWIPERGPGILITRNPD